jgi:hypothetical protein
VFFLFKGGRVVSDYFLVKQCPRMAAAQVLVESRVSGLKCLEAFHLSYVIMNGSITNVYI